MMLILKHKDVSGVLELSTSSSWNVAQESLTVRSSKGDYEMRQMESLTFIPFPGSLIGIPLEKCSRVLKAACGSSPETPLCRLLSTIRFTPRATTLK